MAAQRCVALDGTGYFPASLPLGLFEADFTRAGSPRITSASVEFIEKTHRGTSGVSGAGGRVAAGTIEARLLVEVGATDARGGGGGGDHRAWGDHRARRLPAAESAPTREKVEAAAAGAAAAVTENPAEAEVTIAALAAWNLVATSSIPPTEAVDGLEIRIEVAAVFGDRGDWYTASKSVTLVEENGYSSGGGGGAVPWSARFDWRPAPGVWAKIDGPAVADVKVYGPRSVTGDVSTNARQGGALLLQATLCKRASSGGGRSTAEETRGIGTAGAMRATLMPYAGLDHHAPLEQEGPAAAAAPAELVLRDADAAGAFRRAPVVVFELDDREWWKAYEEEQYGRGMDAVNALSRLPGWKPGDWKKRRRRRRRQEEERERRRRGTTTYPARDDGRKGGGGSGTSSRGRSGWEFVKGAWGAFGRKLRNATRIFSRREN